MPFLALICLAASLTLFLVLGLLYMILYGAIQTFRHQEPRWTFHEHRTYVWLSGTSCLLAPPSLVVGWAVTHLSQ